MYQLKCMALLILLLLPVFAISTEKKPKIIPVSDVLSHIDKTVTVEGKVMRIGQSRDGATYFLNLTEFRGGFTVVIFPAVANQFKKNKIDIKSFEGQLVHVTGKIINNPRFGIQIVLDKTANLVVLDEKKGKSIIADRAPTGYTAPPTTARTPQPTPSAQIIPVSDVLAHVGKIMTVEGKVLRIGQSRAGTTYFLNFTEQRGGFTVVLFPSVVTQFQRNNIDISSFNGKTVQVTGKIDNHAQFGLQIILDSPNQIKIVR